MEHLYLHVPFCVRRCSYCDFSIAVRKRIPANEYVGTVLKEAAGLGEATLKTIYFGGGTPSLLPSDGIAKLLREFSPLFRVPRSDFRVEVTLEANPEDGTRNAEQRTELTQELC